MSVGELGRTATDAVRRPQQTRHAWTVVAMLCVFLIVNYADKIVVGLAGADLMADLHIDARQFGVIQSSFFWCFAAGAIIGGFLINRIRAKYLLSATALLWVLSLMPMIWSESVGVLVASRMMLGFAEGPAAAMAIAVAHTWFTADRRTIPTSVIVAGAGIGPVIAAPLLTLVIVNHSWHAAFGALAVVGLLWVPLWLLVGKEGGVRDAVHVEDVADAPATSWLSALRNRTVIGVCVLMFATYSSGAIKTSWLPLYFHQGLGYDKATAGMLVSLPYAATAVLLVAAGVTSRMLTKRGVTNRVSRAMLPALMVGCAALSTIGFSMVGRGPLNLLLIVVGASLAGGATGTALSTVSDVVPARHRGAVLGFIVAVYSTAGIIGPLVLGDIVAGAATAAEGYSDGFKLLGIVMLVGAVVSFLLINPERDTRTSSQQNRARTH